MKPNIAILILLIVTTCVLAQESEKRRSSQCDRAADSDFAGDLIDIKLERTDIRDFLNYFTEEFGCDFVLDKSVGTVDVEIQVSRTPWNQVLQNALRSRGLDLILNNRIVFVATKDRIRTEVEWWRNCYKSREEERAKSGKEPIHTILTRLKHLPNCRNSDDCIRAESVAEKVRRLLQPRLTEQGSLEVSSRARFVVISDTRKNLDALAALVEIIDTKDYMDNLERTIR